MQEELKEQPWKWLGFDDRWLVLLGIPLLSFSIPLLLFDATLSEGLSAYWPKWLVSGIYTASYWLSARTVFIYFRKRHPGAGQTKRRVLRTWGTMVAVFFLVNLLLGWLCVSFLNDMGEVAVSEFDMAVGSFLILALTGSIYEAVYFYHNWKQTLLEAEQLRRAQAESQLEGLRSQVNPHFLFNSLNTLAYLIPEDEARAVRFVQHLSKVYRYILEIRGKQLVTLEEELSFLEAYRFLVRERFEDNLQIGLEVAPEALSKSMAPLSLQMLLENAIKHNIISQAQPLVIRVVAKGEWAEVCNTLQPKKQVADSTGVGLENISRRYAYFSNRKVEVVQTDGQFCVRLPLIDGAI